MPKFERSRLNFMARIEKNTSKQTEMLLNIGRIFFNVFFAVIIYPFTK